VLASPSGRDILETQDRSSVETHIEMMRTRESILDAYVARTKKIPGERLGDQRLIGDFYLSDKNISGE
jgi:hypothetical protein